MHEFVKIGSFLYSKSEWVFLVCCKQKSIHSLSQRKVIIYISTNNFYFILRASLGDVITPFLVVVFLKVVNSRSIEIDAHT